MNNFKLPLSLGSKRDKKQKFWHNSNSISYAQNKNEARIPNHTKIKKQAIICSKPLAYLEDSIKSSLSCDKIIKLLKHDAIK